MSAADTAVRKPDPSRVRAIVAHLDQLPDVKYAEVVANVVMSRPEDLDVDAQAAMRTPALVAKSLAAVRFHIDQANARLKRSEGEDVREWRRRQEHFKHRMGVERRLLENVQQGVLAQRGIVPNRPNPRQRAMERLKEKHYEDFKRFLEDEKARAKRERKAARKQARQARRH